MHMAGYQKPLISNYEVGVWALGRDRQCAANGVSSDRNYANDPWMCQTCIYVLYGEIEVFGTVSEQTVPLTPSTNGVELQSENKHYGRFRIVHILQNYKRGYPKFQTSGDIAFVLYAFLDIQPLSKGHALVIPKVHAEKLHDVPDENLADILPIAKRIANAVGVPDYNLLQNNGKLAHQEVGHVHFHVIPKPEASDTQGLVIGWPQQKMETDELKKYFEDLKQKLQ